MPKGNYLVILLLCYQGFQNVFARYLFVSHDGQDNFACGNSKSPCRSVRFAVNISNSGDEILIDHAQGIPYKECEYFVQSRCQSIQLKKSLSFSGINGKAVIQCEKNCDLFEIQSSDLNMTKIVFANLIISSSKNVVNSSKTRFEVMFKQCSLKNYSTAVFANDSTYCSIQAIHSNFEESGISYGIWLQCLNLSVHFISTSFNASPVLLQTISDNQNRWQTIDVFVSNCSFDGERKSMHNDALFVIKPFATIVNITVESSRFSNTYYNARYPINKKAYAFWISDRGYDLRKTTLITLNKLIIENNHYVLSAMNLAFARSTIKGIFKVELSNSIFRNNSGPLSVSTGTYKSSWRSTVVLYNITFQKNYECRTLTTSTVIVFRKGSISVISCRFLDNMSGKIPNAAVVTLLKRADVLFENCYFENNQKNTKSMQVFARDSIELKFIGNNTFNIVALKEGQLIFSARMRWSIHIVGRSFRISCPRGFCLLAEKECFLVEENVQNCFYFYISCQECPPKKYSLERGEFYHNTTNTMRCHECPRGGQCEEGQVVAKPNFWGYKQEEEVSFLSCPSQYCCDNSDCMSYHGCYGNRTGTLCGQCPKGMSESLFNTECKSNEQCTNFIFWPGASCLLILYLLFFLYHHEITCFVKKNWSVKIPFILRRRESNDQTSNEHVSFQNNQHHVSNSTGLIKIVFYYYQIIHLFRKSVGSRGNQHILGKLEQIFSRALNLIMFNIPYFDCPFQNLRALQKAAILHSVGYCLLALIALLYFFTKILKIIKRLKNRSQAIELEDFDTSIPIQRNTTSLFSVRIVSAFVHISLLMYSSTAHLCLSLLHCVPVGDSQVLFIDGTIKCFQPFQYVFVAYMIFSILPFCLVPVLGSYLLKVNRISVCQFCMACILPLPFCCFWIYLLLQNHSWNEGSSYSSIEQESDITTQEMSSEASPFRTTILRVILGPFKSHKPLLCFPSSVIPWEGFLIFRRLVLIIVLTFIYDNRLRMIIALIMCVAILVCHMYVHPFVSARENFLETLSLATLILLCGFTLVKALYKGEDFSSSSNSLPLLDAFNIVEDILIITPLAIVIFIVILSLLIRLTYGLGSCVRA